MRNVVRDFIRNFVLENFLLTQDARALRNDASLSKMGLLDASGAAELLAFIAETFGIQISEDQLFLANLDSVDRLVAFIDKALSKPALRLAGSTSRYDLAAEAI